MRVLLRCLFGLALALTVGCGNWQRLQSKQAVEQAIRAHLAQQPDILLAQMTFEVQEVNFNGDQADAEVLYRSKQSSQLAVRIRYVLKKADDHWEVKSSSPVGVMGADPHAAAVGQPAQHPPAAASPQPLPSH